MKSDTTKGPPKTKPATDWDRLRGQTDEEIDAALANDPDVQPTDEAFWKDARVVIPAALLIAQAQQAFSVAAKAAVSENDRLKITTHGAIDGKLVVRLPQGESAE